MLKRMMRVLLLTASVMFVLSVCQPPVTLWADGDPDEIIERSPGPDPETPPPPPPTGGGIPPGGEELGDPDEIIEGQNPFAPQHLPGALGDGVGFWLTLQGLQSTLFLLF